MNEKTQPPARVKIVADITVDTQALLVKLLKRNKDVTKVGLITHLIQEEARREGIIK